MPKAPHFEASRKLRTAGYLLAFVLLVTSLSGWAGFLQVQAASRQDQLAASPSLSEPTAGDSDSNSADDAVPGDPPKFAVKIRRPSGPPVIELKPTDPLVKSGRATCSTCHRLREPNPQNRTPGDLRDFHQNMSLAHGNLTCYMCHNPDDTDTLRLADGQPVQYQNVMTLCAQCHGVVAKDYARVAHGGMSGYWDLTRGERIRNNCIDCHDPHVPQFPKMQPTFKPRDRFLTPSGHDVHH